MTSPLEHVTAGQKINDHLISLVSCYLYATGKPVLGTVVTATLANEAIDWWKALGDLGRLDAAENYRDWKEGQ